MDVKNDTGSIMERIDDNLADSEMQSGIDEERQDAENGPDPEKMPQNEEILCAKCGAVIGEDMVFCPKCGTPKPVVNNYCAKCGAELTPGQEFCHKCGHKVGEKVVATRKKAVFNKAGILKIVLPVIVIMAAVVVIVMFVKPKVDKIDIEKEQVAIVVNETEKLFYTVYPEKASRDKIKWISSDENVAVIAKDGTITAMGAGTCTISAEADGAVDKVSVSVKSAFESYMEQAMYQEALDAAISQEEVDAALFENLCAVKSAFAKNALKNPYSFILNDAYLYEKSYSKQLVMNISGTNGFGASVSSYWLFVQSDSGEWEYWNSLSDLEDEKEESWDDADDTLEKAMNNLSREYIRDTLKNGKKLDKEAVKRINQLFNEEKLDSVTLLSKEEF